MIYLLSVTPVLLLLLLLLMLCRVTSAQRGGQQLPSKIEALQSEWNQAETKFDHQQVCVCVCVVKN